MSETPVLFKDYVDDYISKTTDHKTAGELLKSKVKTGLSVVMFPNIKRTKFVHQFIIKQELDFNAADFIRFLNFSLNIFPEYFHEWTEYDLNTSVPIVKDYDEHHICTEFGKTNLLAKITVIHEGADPKNPVREFWFDVVPRVMGTISLESYKCAVRAVPVMRAAVEYYLNVYLKNQTAETNAK